MSILKSVVEKAARPLHPWQIDKGVLNEDQIKTLQSMSIYFAVPMYGGNCSGNFTAALLDLITNFAQLGVKTERQFLFNESLVQRARNTLVHGFLKSTCEWLFFIDSDVAFSAPQALEFLLAAKLGNHKLVGASYRMKTINWTGIRGAITAGVPDSGLWHCSGQHVVRLDANQTRIQDWFAPVRAKYLATGFMLVHRSVFEAMRSAKLAYKLNQRLPDSVMGETIYAFFDCLIDETGEYLSEDYLFSKRCTDLGIASMLCPWVHLTHSGMISFDGCLTCSTGVPAHKLGQEVA